MLTPISTISGTTWAGASAPPRPKLKARQFWLPRPRGPFAAAEALLLLAGLAYGWNRPDGSSVVLAIAACELVFHINGLDRSIITSSRRQFLIDILKSILLGLLGFAVAVRFVPSFGPQTFAFLWAALVCGLLPLMLRPFFRYLARHKLLGEGILVVGTADLAAKLCRAVRSLGGVNGHRKIEAHAPIEFPGPSERTLLVGCEELRQWMVRDRLSQVVVAETDAQRRAEVSASLLDCRLRGLRVRDAVDFYEECSGKIWLDGLYPQWLVYTDGFRYSPYTLFLKRLFDTAVAALLLVATAPLLAVIAVAIKLNSRGSVLFRQVRVGLHGETFVLYKFRSMREDAEDATGPVWAAERDHRVTAVGRILRKFRLDELPQAFNVLRGEMSLVGPRPERPYFVELLERQVPFYNLRHYVKPGITGWAQVTYSYGSSIEDAYEKLQFDLYYAKHMSLAFDAEILMRTLRIVLFGRGR